MAESLIVVGAKNAHTFNRTIGANSVEDEVVLLGENYLASYTVGFDAASSIATGGKHVIQVMAGASLKVRIRRIEIWQQAIATTGGYANFRLMRLNSAGTGGSAQTPQSLDSSDSAAGATAMTLPTVNGGESTAVAILSAWAYAVQTIGASPAYPTPMVVWDFDRPRSKPLIIPAGTANGIAVRIQTGVAAAAVVCGVWFDESNF